MLNTQTIEAVLTQDLGIDPATVQAYEQQARDADERLLTVLSNADDIDETQLYQAIANRADVQFMSLNDEPIDKNTLTLIPAPLAETHYVVAFEKQDDAVKLAMADPGDIQTIEFIRRKTGLTPEVYLATLSDIKQALKQYHQDLQTDIENAGIEKKEQNEHSLKKAADEVSVINVVESILEHAVYQSASDIHIEPTNDQVIVRYRIDGVLRKVMELPENIQQGLIARIKILATLKIDEHMVPQDGRFTITLHEEPISFRVSIMPVYNGEKVVMRLLHEGAKPLDLEQLGFLPGPKEMVASAITKPHGMILVTGPTGSGKTTSLYSVLGMINRPEVNICTIEDPIEYHVDGINQSQINPKAGFSFAGGLRAFLRQDPDIIMVGEIRDQETAEIAMHAAMTGHLVLSTLHTNDAPTTLPRLIDMNIPPFLVAFTTNIIVAQRLVRRLCDHCKEEVKLTEKQIGELDKIVDMEKLLGRYQAHGIALNKTEKELSSLTFYHADGCGRCHQSGYSGRIGIYEVLDVNKDIEQLINERATAKQIGEAAREKQDMITMFEDGMIKAKQGMTSIEEVLRVTRD